MGEASTFDWQAAGVVLSLIVSLTSGLYTWWSRKLRPTALLKVRQVETFRRPGDRKSVVLWEIVNTSAVPFIVRGIYGTSTSGRLQHTWHIWLKREHSGLFFTPSYNDGAPTFPHKIETADMFSTWVVMRSGSGLEHLLEARAFYATDQFDRLHWFRRKDVEAMQANVRRWLRDMS